MPIDSVLDLQRRDLRLGELRNGTSVAVPGKNHRQPKRLETWRFTTASQANAEAVAEHFGGTVAPWEIRKGRFEVITDRTALDVWVPPTLLAVDANMEMWDGPKRLRRCNGATMSWPPPQPGQPRHPCMCPQPEDPTDELSVEAAGNRRRQLAAQRPPKACSPRTQVNLTIPDLPGLTGVWHYSTGSENAAMETTKSGDAMTIAREGGVYLPAVFRLEWRYRVVDGAPFPVAVLQIGLSMEELTAGALPPGPKGLMQQIAARRPERIALLSGGRAEQAALPPGQPSATTRVIDSADVPAAVREQAIRDLAGEDEEDEVVDAEFADDEDQPAAETAEPSEKPKQDWTAQDIANTARHATSPQEIQDLISLARANRVHQDNALTDPGPPEVWEDLTPYLLHLRRDLAGRRAAA